MHAFKSLVSGPLSVFMSGPGTFATDFFSAPRDFPPDRKRAE